MTDQSLDVQRAQPGDVGKVVSIMDEIALWMVTSGIKQWPYPSPQSYRDLIARESAQGNVYLVWALSESRPVGTFRLEWRPSELWAGKVDDAANLYSLAVSRRIKGQGIGIAIISWLEAHLEQQGCVLLRLDCVATNASLRCYYEELGFALVGEAVTPWYPAALYEKRLAGL